MNTGKACHRCIRDLKRRRCDYPDHVEKTIHNNQKEMRKIFLTHNKEREIGEFNIHRANPKQ